MNIIERVVNSVGEPGKHDLWLRSTSNGAELLAYLGDRWVPIAGGGGGDSCKCGLVKVQGDPVNAEKLSWDGFAALSDAWIDGNIGNAVKVSGGEMKFPRKIYHSENDSAISATVCYDDNNSDSEYKLVYDSTVYRFFAALDNYLAIIAPGYDLGGGYYATNVINKSKEGSLDVVAPPGVLMYIYDSVNHQDSERSLALGVLGSEEFYRLVIEEDTDERYAGSGKIVSVEKITTSEPILEEDVLRIPEELMNTIIGGHFASSGQSPK